MNPPCLNLIKAWVAESTKSSCSPAGNAANSSITSSANLLSGAQTIPDANRSATALTLAILSLPLLGVYSDTGIPICLNSNINGIPAALPSTIKASGCHSLYISKAFFFKSGNSSLSL